MSAHGRAQPGCGRATPVVNLRRTLGAAGQGVPVVPYPVSMIRTRRCALVGLVALLVVALATPAGAESASSTRRRREQARSKRAELAKKIDALKASDDDLDRAVQTLNSQARAQQARVAAARQ